MKELKFLTICPDDVYYTWQIHLWLESLKNINQSDKAIVLVFIPFGRIQDTKWEKIIDLYPEVEFHFYKGDIYISSLLSLYIPILRPWTALQHFKSNIDLSDKAIFYCDSDILFMPNFDINNLINDNINYLSNTNSYINATYFDSKIAQVLPEKLEEYKTRDILQECCELVGINRNIAITNNSHSGGAQYLLKNINANFWQKVLDDTISIRKHLLQVNKEFFKDENSEFQGWCSDMWGILWNLWFHNKEVKVINSLNFAWSSDSIELLNTHTILHNAGIVSETGNGYLAFYKGKYHKGIDPTKDPILDIILDNNDSKEKCTWFYTKKLKELSNKYKINYS